MRIAQIAPLTESVPPEFYGGTERIVSYLTEELVRQGHEVSLFASGDSVTRGELVSCAPRALRLDGCRDQLAAHVLMLERVRARAHDYDILHFHLDYLPFPTFRALASSTLTTLHGRQDLPELQPLYAEFRDMPLVSISRAQRAPLGAVRWVGTVHHGLPPELFRFSPQAEGGYLAFLGRISPEKRPDRAVEIAARAGMKLRVAAKIDAADREYFETCIAPIFRQPHVEFVGEIGEAEKAAFLGKAEALLFPVDWPEPFGLVMIEAMACGTPVIAWRCGSVPEIVEEGVTGFIIESIDEAAETVHRLGRLDRARIRRRFEERFTTERMTGDYLAIYQHLCALPTPQAA